MLRGACFFVQHAICNTKHEILMDDLYRQVIIERYKTPYYRGHLDPHDIFFEDDNPVCGDHIEITLRVDEKDTITEAAFDGHGCSISQASADLLMEEIHGKTLDEIKALTKEDIVELIGFEMGPVRLKCALLSLKVLKAGAYGLSVDEVSDDLV